MRQSLLTAQGAQAALAVEDGIFLRVPAQDNLRLPVERPAGAALSRTALSARFCCAARVNAAFAFLVKDALTMGLSIPATTILPKQSSPILPSAAS